LEDGIESGNANRRHQPDTIKDSKVRRAGKEISSERHTQIEALDCLVKESWWIPCARSLDPDARWVWSVRAVNATVRRHQTRINEQVRGGLEQQIQ
jgi:hypothetical protein